ncbi:MAG TPA: response regulator transcription factor [Candidatus Limnocylindrales bacterium]|nr:response regulator transcription factor [Candidatus Limnocylindrales bacterium]
MAIDVLSTTAATRPLTVLVVDDEPPIIELVAGYVEREHWHLLRASDGEQALAIAREQVPDVIVLDVMLPALDGLEVCRRLRTFSDAYVLMLTARSDELDRIVGLSVGADDYLVKPFSPRELIARIKAMLRRPRTPLAAAQADAPLAIDLAARRVTVDGRAVTLSLTEFELLAALMRDPGVVISRQRLLDRVWGTEFVGDDHLIDVHIGNLRAKLGDEAARPRFIETVRGVGFRFITEDS